MFSKAVCSSDAAVLVWVSIDFGSIFKSTCQPSNQHRLLGSSHMIPKHEKTWLIAAGAKQSATNRQFKSHLCPFFLSQEQLEPGMLINIYYASTRILIHIYSNHIFVKSTSMTSIFKAIAKYGSTTSVEPNSISLNISGKCCCRNAETHRFQWVVLKLRSWISNRQKKKEQWHVWHTCQYLFFCFHSKHSFICILLNNNLFLSGS